MAPVGNPVVEAVVQVGDVATPYLRCGRGECLVLVTLGAAERLRLLAALARDHCVVAPLPPAGPWLARPAAELAEWLRGVLDGLGLQPAEIVVGPDAAQLGRALAGACEASVRILRPAGSPGRGTLPAES